MPRITRRLDGVDAGHRLLKHEGKCKNYHGHRYTFDITCVAEELDEVCPIDEYKSYLPLQEAEWLEKLQEVLKCR